MSSVVITHKVETSTVELEITEDNKFLLLSPNQVKYFSTQERAIKGHNWLSMLYITCFFALKLSRT